ncbi:hydroxyisourate hydrolase-like [Vicia villosa]|uniref:hydroxyisourate hydrolase-like n=1 Tax=Vicia villosa TaxID=3911 RepID=UPI00273CB907|nr:hydroxyisourate hydrolase-like [Vicia villosa]
MKPEACFVLSLLVFILSLSVGVHVRGGGDYSISDFPLDFVFGDYQVEGAANEDERNASIWDTFAHVDGRGPVNLKGLQYYNNLINELISNGIQPHVTLHNYNLPQALEDDYEGWISRHVMNVTCFCVGVRLSDGREFFAKIIISNATRWDTFGWFQIIVFIIFVVVNVQEEMRNRQIESKIYVIIKTLTKPPEAYPDAKNQPHVLVAQRLKQQGHTSGCSVNIQNDSGLFNLSLSAGLRSEMISYEIAGKNP